MPTLQDDKMTLLLFSIHTNGWFDHSSGDIFVFVLVLMHDGPLETIALL